MKLKDLKNGNIPFVFKNDIAKLHANSVELPTYRIAEEWIFTNQETGDGYFKKYLMSPNGNLMDISEKTMNLKIIMLL